MEEGEEEGARVGLVHRQGRSGWLRGRAPAGEATIPAGGKAAGS